jgi:phospholipase/carboxylesterase
VLKRGLFVIPLIGFVAAVAIWLWIQGVPLAAISRGGSGPPTLVLLHGYGSRAEDWLQFDEKWQLPANARRLYPQGPWRGFSRRGWWWLHLETYVPPGQHWPDLSQASPGGIQVASRMVRDLLERQQEPIVLGGFSQGAMISAEVAFQSDQELAGMILIGGTTVHEEAWAEHFAGRRHLPIFIAHGRSDQVLSFEIMERFQARLKAFGLNVTWFPYEGGHEIPDVVVHQVNAFIGRILTGR